MTPPAAEASAARGRRGTVASVGLILAWAAAAAAAVGVPVPGALVPAGLAWYLLALAPATPRAAVAHLAAGAVAAAMALALLPAGGAVVGAGLARAGMLAALFAALATLRAAAEHAPGVVASGDALARQPPGSRYAAMTLGGHAFGIVLNFGVVQLLGPMIAAGRPPPAMGLLERRLFLGVLRGFSTVLFWSPLSLAFALVSSTLTGVAWGWVIAGGLGLTAAVLALGARLDRRGAGDPAPRADRAGPRRLAAELAPVVRVALALVIVVGALAAGVTGRLIDAVVTAIPAFAATWLLLQARHRGQPRAWLGERAAAFAARQLPAQQREVAVLCNAAFLGGMAEAAVAQTAFSASTVIVPAAATVLLPAALIAAILLAGLAGANPLLSVALLAAVFAEPAAWGLSPAVTALALMTGWGLTLNVTPAAAVLLMISRFLGVTPRTVGQRWNGRFVLAAYALVAGALTLAQALVPLCASL